jgi:Family of unknown function (DUF6188)
MYGLPKNFDAAGFIGRTLEVLVVGQYQLTLRFSESCTINVEGLLAIDSGAPIDLPDSMNAVYPLINQTIESASATEDGTLSLIFGNGTILRILDSETTFESYNFSLGGKELFVV